MMHIETEGAAMQQSFLYTAIRCLGAFVLGVWLSGCTALSAPQSTGTSENPPQLPRPDMLLDIAGLGPCNDNPDRRVRLNSREPVTILVHGCFGSAGRFRVLSDVFAFHGEQSVCFSYDDRDSLMQSSRELADAIEALAAHMPSGKITVIGHSQGGLVARKALVNERDKPLQSDADVELLTVSAPLSGISAADQCANPWLRFGTLGLHDLACWMISGDKWYEITYASDFITNPGTLVPAVKRYLLLATDEEGTCRRSDLQGRCVEDDFVFSLAEQRHPQIERGLEAEKIVVPAGHVEIVGREGVIPRKLIGVLQERGFMRRTQPGRISQFDALLTRLYARLYTPLEGM